MSDSRTEGATEFVLSDPAGGAALLSACARAGALAFWPWGPGFAAGAGCSWGGRAAGVARDSPAGSCVSGVRVLGMGS